MSVWACVFVECAAGMTRGVGMGIDLTETKGESPF